MRGEVDGGMSSRLTVQMTDYVFVQRHVAFHSTTLVRALIKQYIYIYAPYSQGILQKGPSNHYRREDTQGKFLRSQAECVSRMRMRLWTFKSISSRRILRAWCGLT